MADETQRTLIDIDYTSVEAYAKAAADAKQRLEELKAANDALKKSSDATGTQIEASNAAVKNAQKEYNQATAATQKAMAANKAMGNSYDDLYKQWQQAERNLKSMDNAMVKNADGSYTLSEEYKKAAEEVAAMKKAIDDANRTVNNGSTLVGQYGAEVKNAFGDLLGSMGPLGTAMKGASDGVQKMGVSITSLKGAIMASGIGLLLMLVGSLISYFKDSAAGSGALQKAMAYLGAAFNVLLSVFKPVGAWIVSIFTEPKKALSDLVDFIKGQIINRVNGIIKVFKGLWEVVTGDSEKGMKMIGEGMSDAVTGVENFRGKVAKLGDEMRRAAEEAARLAAAQIALDKANQNSIYTFAELQRQIENYKQIADDDTRSMKEREAAARQADKLERDLLKSKLDLATRAYNIAKAERDLNAKSGRDSLELRQKAAELFQAAKEAETAYTSAANTNMQRLRKIQLDNLELQLDSLEKGFDAVKATNLQIIGDDRKTVAERRLVLEALIKTRNKSAEQEMDLLQSNTKKQIDLQALVALKDSVAIQKRLQGLGLSEKATIRLQDIVKNYMDTNTEFADQQKALDEKALARRIAFNAKDKELINDIYNRQRDQQYTLAQQEVEINAQTQTTLAEQQIKNADERALRIQEIEMAKNSALRDMALAMDKQLALDAEQQRYDKAKADLAALQLETDQKNKLIQDTEAQHMQIMAGINQNYNEQKKANAAQTEQEITAKHKTELDMRKKALEGSLQVASDVFGTMSELAGKQTKVGKALAVTQGVINMFSSAISAYNSAAQVPLIGYILGPIAAGAALAAGAKNLAAIKSADSGSASGAGSSGGSTVSASFTALSSASAVSQMAASQNGSAQNNTTQSAAQQAGNATAEALRSNPPVVAVDTFEAKQAEKSAIVSKATI